MTRPAARALALRRIDDAPTARDAFREAIALQAVLKPRLRRIATALDVLRRSDSTADAAWRERELARLARCEEVVRRLHDEDDLVIDQGWTTTRYAAT